MELQIYTDLCYLDTLKAKRNSKTKSNGTLAYLTQLQASDLFSGMVADSIS